MDEKITTARLIATVLRARLEQGVRFGIILPSLPPFDLFTFYITLQPEPNQFRVALLGFENIDERIPPEIARNIETVVEWRNEDSLSNRIVVIINTVAKIEKTHSLGMFETFSDQDLRIGICQLAAGEAQAATQYLQARVWIAVRHLEQSPDQRFPIVAKQIAEFYHALQMQSVEYALPHLGLLPDKELRPVDNIAQKLRENRDLVEWMVGLDETAFRTLARASGDDDSFSQTFRLIKEYRNRPAKQTLQALSVQAVRALRQAPKSPRRTEPKRRSIVPADRHLIEQLLDVANEQDAIRQQAALKRIEDQASRISQIFYRPLPDNFGEDAGDDERQGKFETLLDVETGEEAGRAEPFIDDDEKRHPLAELFQEWIRSLSWGGQVDAEIVDSEYLHLPRLFDGKIALHFKPLQPLDRSQASSLVNLLHELDEAGVQYGQVGGLSELFEILATHRRELVAYQEQFLYYPQFAAIAQEVSDHLQSYIQTYQELGRNLNEAGRRLQEFFPDAVAKATAQFLALDTIRIHLGYPGQASQVSLLLSPLHPLHLWKWARLTDYLYNFQRPITPKEQASIAMALSRLPTLLNTFVLHSAMYDDTGDQTEQRLVLAGEIHNPANEASVGVPFYQALAHQVTGNDAVQEASSLIRQFLILYPPAQIGLTLVLINPPRLSQIFEKLVELYHTRQSVKLHGAKIYVFWTKNAAYDEWKAKDEEALELFRTDPRWMLYIDLETRTLNKINDELLGRRVYPHIVLLCDPSSTVVRSIFRTALDETSPFGIPTQLTYDKISNKHDLVSIAAGGLFDVYSNLRNVLSGESNVMQLGTGNRGAKTEDLQKILTSEPRAHWLIILDRPQGSLESPSNLGKRLVWLPSGTRTLTLYTGDDDWKRIWKQHLQQYLVNLGLSTDAETVLDSLLDFTPLSQYGLLDLVQFQQNSHINVFSTDRLKTMLCALAVRNWYRQHHPGVILLSIGGEDFDDWYADFDFKGKTPPYYLAVWPEEDDVGIDLIAVNNDRAVFSTSETVSHLVAFARTIDALFNPANNTFILTPLRRDTLRERLIAAIFVPSAKAGETSTSPIRQSKAKWTHVINRLFQLARNTPLRILHITVTLQEFDQHTEFVEEAVGIEVNEYENLQAILSGGWLLKQEEARPNQQAPEPSQSEDTATRSTNQGGVAEAQIQYSPDIRPETPDTLRSNAARLQRVLEAYGLAITGVDALKSQIGPRFIRYWVQLQPPTGRLSEVQKYAEDIAREMGSRTVPLIDNIPGERYIGIDLARDEPTIISLTPAVEQLASANTNQLLIAAGQSPAGKDILLNLAKLPHMLVAGQTGSGKTVFLSSLITSLVFHQTAANLQLLLVDPKQMDFGIFSDLPHLVNNRILYEPEEAIEALRTLLQVERPRRTEILKQANCPNSLEYNRRHPDNPLPWLVVVIDEFADLVLGISRREREEFERQINRLAATGRAVGIHLVIATQRPTTDIITGTIKANITARVSFRLPSQVDSRTILDRPGAENLLGQGDMLISIDNDIQRLQGYYATFDEFRNLLSRLKG